MAIKFEKFWKALCLMGAMVVSGHIVSVLMTYGSPNNSEWGYNILLDLFFFGHEKNLTALFSALFFMVVALCFHNIAKVDIKYSRYWGWLRNIVIYLACDEWFAIHDAALNVYGLGPFNIPYWVWVYAIVFSFIFLFYIKFFLRMEKNLLKYLIGAGCVYISGAAIMEAVTYQFNDFSSLKFQVGLFFEDGLEIAGILLAIYGCFLFLKKQNKVALLAPKKTSIAILVIGVVDFLVFYVSKLLH